MSRNNQEYDDQNDDSQNYDDQDQDQEYDSQEDNSQNNGDNDGDDGDDCDNDDDNDCNNDEDDDENTEGPKYIRLRGLPWSATHKEILDFLKGIEVVGGADGIHIVTRRWDGVNSGEAYVELKGKQDAAAAMKLDNATMGHRYIEVFNASPREAKDAMRKTSSHGVSYVVKLRGLPYSVTEQQVEEFFNGLEIKPDREGIVFVMDRRGRATGEAFVQFESQEDTEQALGRNRQKIGHRYIEIFRSSLAELKRSTNGSERMAPYDLKDRGSNRGGSGSDYGGNNRSNRWGNNGGFGVGANNTLGFSNMPNFGNNGNFGSNSGGNFGNFGNNSGGGGGRGMGNFGNFGNSNNGNSGGNFGNFGNNNGGNFGNNSGGGNMGSGGGFNRFSSNSGNFGNDFGDFVNFGNNRGNNMGSGGGGGGGSNMGSGGGSFNNFNNFGNGGGNNMGGGGGFGNNMGGGPGNGGGNFGPIGGGRNDDLYMIMMRGLPFSSFEKDVYKFFEPQRPVNVRIHYNKQNGRHNGTAEALFETYDDAQLAMKRHRCKMGQRYIELFFNGKSKSGKGGGNNYSPGGNMSGGGSIGSGNKSIGLGGGMSGGNAFSRRI